MTPQCIFNIYLVKTFILVIVELLVAEVSNYLENNTDPTLIIINGD